MTTEMPAVHIVGVGKRYRHRWALRDCDLQLPAGRIVALVGPNGAGKSTLMHVMTGLSRPSTGTVRVFGLDPAAGTEALRRIGFVAQDKPLYRDFTVAEMLRWSARMNPMWDASVATSRLDRLGIPVGQKVRHLSGGQRAQVALALVLGKHPSLMLLDEPLANLDPVARDEVMRAIVEEVTGSGLTAVLSSHVVSELEQVCDYLVLLESGRVRLFGVIRTLLAGHSVLTSSVGTPPPQGGYQIVGASRAEQEIRLLVRIDAPVTAPEWATRAPTLEELVLGYMRTDSAIERSVGVAA